MRKLLFCLMWGAMQAGWAQPPAAPSPVPTSEVAPEVGGEESLEPQVTIVQRREQVIEEYRINGQLYMIRIIPKKGRPYYLVDSDGDGFLDARRNDLASDLMIPSWVLWRW